MNAHDEDRIKLLLQQALPPADPAAEPSRDLWPAVLRRLDASPAAAAPGLLRQKSEGRPIARVLPCSDFSRLPAAAAALLNSSAESNRARAPGSTFRSAPR